MATKTKPRVIALEEHYWDKDIASHFKGHAADRAPKLLEQLYDLGAVRLKEMDETGIDVQVISHGAPSGQQLPVQVAAQICREANDRLAAACAANPKRFAAFATLPTPDPKAAADELERCVDKLGFVGAMIHGLTHDKFIDRKEFWPIFERAAALDAPIYLHPAEPHPAVDAAYYADYAQEFPGFRVAGWGFGVETATQAIRLVLSGACETYPNLKFILGHMGENLPFALWRIDHTLARRNKSFSFRDAFCAHFWVTTSGFFSTPALNCTIQEMGVERVLFSIDWPFVDNAPGTAWMDALQLSAADKARIYGDNAAKLLKI
jgi:predicted TIM-barrel fold metal-dependent hydrolase